MRFSPAAAAIVGIAGTVAMTAAMRLLHRRLPLHDRYPLPPRELTEEALPALPEAAAQEVTLLSHACYGAVTAFGLPLLAPDPGPGKGALYGLAVWGLSYLGWIPALGLLKPADRHPPARNLAMAAVHLVWGAVTALSLRELNRAEREIFSGRVRPDAKEAGR
ncbi:hypothetical protein FKB34_05790 [Glycocaulis profundi]|nr:hypothetical protein FKB34_05790 [Glycocaulis profundi]